MRHDQRVEMVDYDPVKEMARISFISSKGNPTSVYIHRQTFKMLMVGPWNREKYGDPYLNQKELKEAAQSSIKKSFEEWFETSSNELMKRRTGVPAETSE